MIFSLKTGPWAGMFSGSMFAILGFGVQDFRIQGEGLGLIGFAGRARLSGKKIHEYFP